MITVEEKLKLFSKIVFEKVEKKNEDQLSEYEKMHKSIINNKTGEFEKQANSMLEKGMNEIEKEKVLIISKAKMNEKKLILKTKNNLLNELLLSLAEQLKSFVNTDKYKEMFIDEINKTSSVLKDSNEIIVELTGKDMERFKGDIKKAFKNKSVELKENNDLIGGFYAIDVKNEVKVDFSLMNKIDMSREAAGEQLFNLLQ